MKNSLLILTLILGLSCCKKDDAPVNPIDQLPAATQTGAQTFGCLINGEAFIPDKFGSGTPRAFYQLVNGKYTLGISASRKGGPNLESISLSGIDVEPIIEATYSLIEESPGNFNGRYKLGGGAILRIVTASSNPGSLVITNFDEENFIISGTFEFTVKDNDNKEIKITDGRFDLRYTN